MGTNFMARYGLQVISEFQAEMKSLYVLPPFIPPLPTAPLASRQAEEVVVGIIGAGTAGLYTAMLLDWIKVKYNLNLRYEILEASPRIGGRVWTHDFGGGDFDYYDLGPMRYPYIPIMSRIFDLFVRLGLGNVSGGSPDGKLIEYRMSDPNSVLYFNDVRYVGPPTTADVFEVGISKNGLVPDSYVEKGYQFWVDETLNPFRAEFVDEEGNPTWDRGWKFLKPFDHHSMRSYMAAAPATIPSEKQSIPQPVIDWCETMSGGTGLYNSALSETVLGSLTFNYPFPEFVEEPEDLAEKMETKWYCIKGGSEVLVKEMEKNINIKPVTNKQVTKITHNKGEDHVSVTVRDEVDEDGNELSREYSHVISTIPLSTLRLIEFNDRNCLTYAQRLAFRLLEYMPSVKIALKFTTRWWTKLPEPVSGGRSSTDLNVRMIVYPSYGSDSDTGVLLVSYTFAQDSLRLGALSQADHTLPKQYRDFILRELATIHGVDFDDLDKSCTDDWIWDWSSYEHSIGAFAHFGPGQFKNIYPHVTYPAAEGRVHFVGEATSVLHGWINGALDSAVRGVLQMMYKMDLDPQLFIDEWGLPPETNLSYVKEQVFLGTVLTSGKRLPMNQRSSV